MNLPQPDAGQLPNIEMLWAGDAATMHLTVSIRVGTFFGVSNEFASTIAREVVDCETLCECDIHADTGDLLATFHVEAADWPDYAHAIVRKVFRHVAMRPVEWNRRSNQTETMMIGEKFVTASPRRMN